MEIGVASVAVTETSQVTDGIITLAKLASDAKLMAFLWGTK